MACSPQVLNSRTLATSLQAADQHPAGAELASVIEQHSEPPAKLLAKSEHMFSSLVRSIVYQQLAGSAASAIHGRFLTACKVSHHACAALLSAIDTRSALARPDMSSLHISHAAALVRVCFSLHVLCSAGLRRPYCLGQSWPPQLQSYVRQGSQSVRCTYFV